MCSLNTTYVHTPFHTPLPQPCLLTHSPHVQLHVGFHPYTSEQLAGPLIYAYQSTTHRPYASMHSVSNLHCSLELSLTRGADQSTLKPRVLLLLQSVAIALSLCLSCILPFYVFCHRDEVNSCIAKPSIYLWMCVCVCSHLLPRSHVISRQSGYPTGT